MRPFPFAASKWTVFGIVASILRTCTRGHIPQRGCRPTLPPWIPAFAGMTVGRCDGRWRDGHAGEGVLGADVEAGLGEGERI